MLDQSAEKPANIGVLRRANTNPKRREKSSL